MLEFLSQHSFLREVFGTYVRVEETTKTCGVKGMEIPETLPAQFRYLAGPEGAIQ